MFKHLFNQERSKTVIIYYNCFQMVMAKMNFQQYLVSHDP